MNSAVFVPHHIATTAGALYILAIVAVMACAHALRAVSWIYIIAVLPGTLAHELMHYVVGLFLNGHPQGLSVMPTKTPQGYTLGSVGFTNLRWYNGALIGLAPLLLILPVVFLLNWRLDVQHSLVGELAWVYGFACLLLGALPSKQDVKIAIGSSWVFIMLIFAALWLALR